MKHSQLDSYRELEKADDEINSALHRLEGEGAPSAPEIISMIFGNPFEIAVLGSLLHHIFPDAQIRRFESSTDWENEKSDASNIEIVLYNLGDRRISDPDVKTEVQGFIKDAGSRQVILISRSGDSLAVFHAIDCGASSFIPPNAGVDELVEALCAPASKCVVIPRSSIPSMLEALGDRPERKPGLERFFTERQLAVARALQRGDANKIIAYDLGLCESTVKVHIRNIMRKLKATNRTQAAFRLNELANGSDDIEVLPED